MEELLLKSLKICPLFNGMDHLDIEMALAGTGYKLINYEKNDVYCLAGMPYNSVDIVVAGFLVCRMVSASGRQVEVSRLRVGNLIAPAFIFASDSSMPVSVETGSKVTILRMSRSSFKQLINIDERVRMNFIHTLSDVNAFLTKKVRVLGLLTVREKITAFLNELSEQQGSDTIFISRSRQALADSFGIQKYSLLRVLSELQEVGAIRIEGKSITIVDRSLF